MKKKIVVFGGAGFLGGYVVNELEKRGNYEIIIADIFPSKYDTNAKFIKCDITDYNSVLDVIPENVDVVYNFAGFANLESASENPLPAVNLNVMGNLNVLEAARTKRCKQFVFASSAYAMSNMGSFYGISKLASEKLVEEYHKKYNLAFTIIRYGSVYSERDFDNNYIFNLIKDAIKVGKIIHNGDGNEYREYIHAADAATLSVNIIEDKKYLNQHLILTGSERMKRIELFEMINEILGGGLEIELKDTDLKNHYKTTPYSFQPTASKKLICNPYIDMGQGIPECIKQIKSEQNDTV